MLASNSPPRAGSPVARGSNELSLDVLADPQVRLSLTPRSGPIEIEIEYRVDPVKARLFYAVMQHVQLSRQRNGAYGWSIARDIADPMDGALSLPNVV